MYRDYLKSNHWKEVKKDFYCFKKNHRCHICFSRENLNVHHKNYKSLNQERAKDLTYLCQDCHTKLHEMINKGKGIRICYQLLQALKKKERRENIRLHKEHFKEVMEKVLSL